jgi:hypothetical protein
MKNSNWTQKYRKKWDQAKKEWVLENENLSANEEYEYYEAHPGRTDRECERHWAKQEYWQYLIDAACIRKERMMHIRRTLTKQEMVEIEQWCLTRDITDWADISDMDDTEKLTQNVTTFTI